MISTTDGSKKFKVSEGLGKDVGRSRFYQKNSRASCATNCYFAYSQIILKARITQLEAAAMFKILFTVLLTALMSNMASAQLTDAIRSNFINSYVKSCLKVQRTANTNGKLSDLTFVQHCNCLATNVADAADDWVINEIEQGNLNINVLTTAATKAERACLKQDNIFDSPKQRTLQTHPSPRHGQS